MISKFNFYDFYIFTGYTWKCRYNFMINTGGFSKTNFGRLIIQKYTNLNDKNLSTLQKYKQAGTDMKYNIQSDVIINSNGYTITDNLNKCHYSKPHVSTINDNKIIISADETRDYFKNPVQYTYKAEDASEADEIAYKMNNGDDFTRAVEFSHLINMQNSKTKEGKEYKEKTQLIENLLTNYME